MPVYSVLATVLLGFFKPSSVLESVGEVDVFQLINAITNQPIQNLSSGTIINLAEQATTNFSINAITSGPVGSVRFGYNGNTNFRIESVAPYALCGDGSPVRNFYTCEELTIGQHIISATTFSNVKATGTQGPTTAVSFTITNFPVPAPTKAPRLPPTKSPTKEPTRVPVRAPTNPPTKAPTRTPIRNPTKTPTKAPSRTPIRNPTKPPTKAPTRTPIRNPTKAPTRAPRTAPVQTPTLAPQSMGLNCTIPKFADNSVWQNFLPFYPIKIGEPQGMILGDDLVIIAGFTDYYATVTNHTYARDLTDPNGVWRRMDDLPMEIGVTHTATARRGLKAYMCGGYYGGHPGPHVPYCFVYDHSKAPGFGRQWTRFADLPDDGTAGGGMIYDTERNALFYSGGGQRLTPGDVHPIDRDNTWRYRFGNPDAGWVASAPIPYFANHLSSVTHTDSMGRERHFFAGGQMQEFEAQGNLPDNFEFIASTETWVRRASMTLARSHSTASTRAFGCGFIMAGGSVNSATTAKNRTNDVSYYDIPTDTWTSIGTTSFSVATPVVDIHPNGYMHFVSGTTRSQRRRITDL